MSNSAWHGGKGDKSRITDYKSYSENYDKIYTNKIDNRICLFLDDDRNPENATLWGEDSIIDLIDKSGIPKHRWNIVRSYDEFVEFINNKGIPDVVSFDNDLWNTLSGDQSKEELTKQFQMIGWQDFKIKTGAHCAQYLVDACKAYNKPIPTYYIHTANSAARSIIKEILDNARKN